MKHPQPLKGQSALVTGASSGIGKAVALELARAGADIVVNFASGREAAEEAAHDIRSLGRRALSVEADVTSEEQVEAMFAQAVEAFGTLHIVVCNAGLQRDAQFHEMSLKQWTEVMNVNLTGQFLCARSAVREFRRRGLDETVSRALGKIIHMSSVHEQIPWGGHANYAASKGGVLMLMKTLAQELAPQRIRVNGIAPGAVRTPINKEAWETPDAYERLMKLVPYGRIGEPADIGQAAVWLASDDSDYVTGASLYVDGGMSLYPAFADGG